MSIRPVRPAPAAQQPPMEGLLRAISLVASMIVSVGLVAALAFWDSQRESSASLDDFAQEQAMLAESVASELATRLAVVRRDALWIAENAESGRPTPRPPVFDGYTTFTLRADTGPPHDASGTGLMLHVRAAEGRIVDVVVRPAKLLEGAMRVERPGSVRLLVLGPDAGNLVSTNGLGVESPPVRRALETGQPSVWLSRSDAMALGLKPRLAAAGLSMVDAGPLGRWGIAVVSSAERMRDREQRALWRLVLFVLVTTFLVVVFGTAALRRQRRGLRLEGELALSALARERDADLATANRAAVMGTLAMGIAHEISTPLGIIAGRGEQLLSRLQGDERSARALQIVLDQSERIRRTIRGFLNLVRGDTPVLGDTAPKAVLDGAVGLVEHRFEAARVTLSKDVSFDLPTIRCDVPILQQAIVNLLLNACDACMPGGHVEASIRSDSEHVVFLVVDNGAGITSEAAARATEPFFTTKAQGQGTGLGLAIANEIVKLHRGSLSLRANSPRGTCASISIPTLKVEPHAA